MKRGRIATRSAHADARIRWVIEAARTAWELKLAGARALDPRRTERELRERALRTALRNNPWQPRGGS
jgi:hypothetical protein